MLEVDSVISCVMEFACTKDDDGERLGEVAEGAVPINCKSELHNIVFGIVTVLELGCTVIRSDLDKLGIEDSTMLIRLGLGIL